MSNRNLEIFRSISTLYANFAQAMRDGEQARITEDIKARGRARAAEYPLNPEETHSPWSPRLAAYNGMAGMRVAAPKNSSAAQTHDPFGFETDSPYQGMDGYN